MKYLLTMMLFVSAVSAQSERHLTNIKQLTFGGSNAEAYFSSDGKKLIYQATKDKYLCDQIFTMNVDGSGNTLVSTGDGRTTCGYFFPDGKILYASTHDDDDDCPPSPDRSKGYVWGVFNAYDIYVANADGSKPKKLAATKGYDAEATVSPDGKQVVFTSSRDGDLELYIMNADGSNVRRITNDKGYDGGAFFSPDGKMLVYRAYHPSDPKDIKEGEDLLKEELVKPSKMELFVINTDGTGKRQITHNGAANFAPFFTPDGKKILFSSNVNDPTGYDFDLYLIDLDGKNTEQVTFNKGFDGFPMFSPDGKKLVFVSTRNAKSRHEFNIFLADWVEDPTIGRLQDHVGFLASDAQEGRGTGEPGNTRSAQYIADQFKAIGLQPAGDNATYFQEFEVVKNLELGAANALSAAVAKKRATSYTVKKDFIPVGFSSNTTVSGTVVFAGFGMTADSTYDDYKGIDAKDKIVIALRYSPDGDTPHSKYTKQSALRYKAMQAREKGAKALLLVTSSADDSADSLLKLKYDNSNTDAGLPVFSVTRALVNEWLKQVKLNIDSLRNKIARTTAPASVELKHLTVTLTSDVVQVKKRTSNVVGLLKVNDADEHVVLGAHYDHLGFGGQGSGSLAPDANEIHNGADDNASGTSTVIELARRLAEYQSILKRNILVQAYSGEEMGLLGSAYYTKHPTLPLQHAVTMMNFDMVGRLKETALTVQGTGTSSQWESLLKRYNADSTFHLKFVKDGFGPSDHSSFYSQNVPVLFFFTGLHDDYHRPSDDADKINYAGMNQIVGYAAKLAIAIDTMTGRPDYIKTQSQEQGGSRQGFRVYVGTIPDYSEDANGMLLAGVRENSPAAKAGLLKGDVLVKFGTHEIKNVYDYTYALQEYKPGDVIDVTVIRNKTEKITSKMTLEKRN
jgi:Tol biopolymer transport system component